MHLLQGSVTNAWWDGPYFHPRTWQAKDISATLISQLRKSNHGFEATEGIVCNYEQALESLLTVFPSLRASEGRTQRRRALQQVALLPSFLLSLPMHLSKPNGNLGFVLHLRHA